MPPVNAPDDPGTPPPPIVPDKLPARLFPPGRRATGEVYLGSRGATGRYDDRPSLHSEPGDAPAGCASDGPDGQDNPGVGDAPARRVDDIAIAVPIITIVTVGVEAECGRGCQRCPCRRFAAALDG